MQTTPINVKEQNKQSTTHGHKNTHTANRLNRVKQSMKMGGKVQFYFLFMEREREREKTLFKLKQKFEHKRM